MSSMRVNAAAGRRGMKGFREEEINEKGKKFRKRRKGIQIWECRNVRNPDRIGAGYECSFEANVVDLVGLA